jgi:hypothetical protein
MFISTPMGVSIFATSTIVNRPSGNVPVQFLFDLNQNWIRYRNWTKNSEYKISRKFGPMGVELDYTYIRRDGNKKCKDKGHPATGHVNPDGEWKHSCKFSLTSALNWVGGQWHTPAALPPWKKRWATGPFWTGEENLVTTGILSADCTVQPVTILTELSRLTGCNKANISLMFMVPYILVVYMFGWTSN